jgi:hypothetical protein
VLHIAEPLAGVGSTIFEVNLASVLQLRLVDFIHVEAGIVLILFIESVAASVAHVVAVLGVHLAQLGSDAFSGDNTAAPGLESNDAINIPCKVVLIIQNQLPDKPKYLPAVLE